MQPQPNYYADQLDPVTTIIGLISLYAAVCATIAVMMARRRGRSMVLAFFGGFLFGVLSLLYYLIAGDTIEVRVLREEQAREEYRASQRRRKR